MGKVCGIYKITSPTGRIYIGQSRHINKRFNVYKNGHCKDQPKLYNSLTKYGWDSHSKEVFPCAESELNRLETEYIILFDSRNTIAGLNLQAGGDARTHSQESIDKMRLARLGKKASEATIIKMRLVRKGARKGVKHSESHRINNRNARLGKKAKQSTKDKMTAQRIGELNHKAKIVLNLETGIYYGCIKDAAKTSHIPYDRLVNKLRRGRNNTQFVYA